MKRSGLTISMIFEAFGGNYGESTGNFTALKKVSRGTGDIYSYFSRQALCYNIKEQAGWNITPTTEAGGGNKKVVQFVPSASIKDYPEIDLFGYLKTKDKAAKNKNNQTDIETQNDEETDDNKTKKRSAVVRVSHALALESFNGNYDYQTNMGLAKRENDFPNSIALSEVQRAYYAYSVSIDLDLVGVEKDSRGKIELEIEPNQKIDRVQKLLTTVQYLYRDIKGRRENLAPIFIIGGIYERKNPFFDGRLKVDKGAMNIDIIKNVLKSDEDIKKNTSIGCLDGFFTNYEKLKNDKELKDELQIEIKSIADFFAELNQKVGAYYHAGN
jgi:CRISPR-associated protein Cst2